MKRFESWPLALDAAIEAARTRPFHWRTHNCATFAADCVAAITGERLHAQFAALHKTKRAALANAADAGTLRLWVSTHLHTGEVPGAFAQRGDVVLVAWADRAALGVCVGRQVAALGLQGVEFLPLGAAQCAWRI